MTPFFIFNKLLTKTVRFFYAQNDKSLVSGELKGEVGGNASNLPPSSGKYSLYTYILKSFSHKVTQGKCLINKEIPR